jgi:hypothetical protein
VDEARVDHQRFALEIELVPLVPALVDLEQKAIVREQLPLDRLGEARQLLELERVEREPVQLPRSRQVAGDEQPRAVARPRQRIRLAQLEELSERARQLLLRAEG